MKSTILFKSILLLFLTMMTLWFCSQSGKLELEEGSGVIMDSEWKMEGYVLVEIEPSEVEKDQLPPDTIFKKKVIFPSDALTRKEALEQMVHATIVLSGADSRSIHRPEVCLPGQGWDLLTRKKVKVKLDRGDLTVMQLELERSDTVKGGEKQLTRAVYSYFLVGKDLAIPSTMERILISNWDNLIHDKAHRWAYPSFMSSYVVKGDGADAQRGIEMHDRVNKVIAQICPQILKESIILK